MFDIETYLAVPIPVGYRCTTRPRVSTHKLEMRGKALCQTNNTYASQRRYYMYSEAYINATQCTNTMWSLYRDCRGRLYNILDRITLANSEL